jgi:hypothetical protein
MADGRNLFILIQLATFSEVLNVLEWLMQEDYGALVRQRTIPTERPPLVGEVSANFSGQRVSRGHRNDSPRSLISVF